MTDLSDRTARSPAVDAPFLLALVDLSPDGMALLEGVSPLEATITWTNASFDRLVLPAGGSAVGRSVLELVPVGDEAADAASDAATAITEATRWGDALVRGRDGAVVARMRPVPTPPGRTAAEQPRWALVASSTTATGVADEALRASEERFRALAANAPMGVFFSEVGLRLGYVNDRFSELWGQPAAAVLGMGWLDSVHAGDTAMLVDALSAVLTGEPFDLVVRVRRGDGEQRWIRVRAAPVRLPGHGAGFVGSLEDVTDSRRQAEQLAHQATHDPLTGLPNRTLLWQRLEESLAGGGPGGRGAGRRRGRERKVALLFFDLDDFKLVNDSLGHAAGDELLTTVAGRLSDGVRPEDMVVRLGGDEFVVLCHAAGQAEATRIAERLQASVRQPVALEGTDIVISASVGVVVADGDHSAEGLLRDADVAMYQAKQAGKARYAVFDQRVREGLQDRLSLSADLRRAVAGGELGVVYQPVWDVRGTTPVAVGLEALVRWDHPVRGSIPATQIITLADEHGLIDELGALIVRRACTDLARWHRELPGAAQLGVGVNLCTSQLRDSGLVDRIATALADAGLSPADLWLELTETVVVEDIDVSAHVLDDLRALGLRLIVDDFGTGYSSLAYLHRLPVQGVKIDRRFVGRLEESASDAAIVAAIVAMADALGLTATAEGVERPGQLAELQRLGCAQAQGYLLSRPVSAAEVPAALSRPVLPSSRPLGPRRTPAPSAP